MGLALSMLIANQAVSEKISNVKSSIGNTITVSPAGMRGFEGGGEALTSAQMAQVAKIANVTNVTQTLNDRLTTSNTNLQSAVEAGSLGNRAQNNSGVGFQAPPDMMIRTENGISNSDGTNTQQFTRTFTPPVMVTGTNNTTGTSVFGGDSVTFTSGKAFDGASTENVAVVGTSIAEKNSLSVGSTFTAYGETVKVVGIYDTGNAFANNGVIMPLATLQRLSGQSGAITSATITVNSVDNIDTVVTAVKKTLGTSADVVSDQETAKTAVQPLESVKTISTYSLVGSLVAGAVIILLTMMMIVRERRREIGVMKAIGSSNGKTMVQFVSEAVTLTFLGLIVGLGISMFASQPITNVLVNNSSSTTTTSMQQGPGMGGGGGMRRIGRPGSVTNNAIRGLDSIKTSVGLDVLAYGVGVAFLIAIAGSALPAYAISKVRPAEVMRAD